MSGPCPTLDSLIALGLERRTTQGRTGRCRLQVRSSRFGRCPRDEHVCAVRGFAEWCDQHCPHGGTRRIPNSWRLGKRLGSCGLGQLRPQVEQIPTRTAAGLVCRRGTALGPGAASTRGARGRQRAYEVCPKCFVDRDYARPLRRNLVEELSWLPEESEMTFSFDGRVLSISLCDRIHEVIASGDNWPSSYKVKVYPETELPGKAAGL